MTALPRHLRVSLAVMTYFRGGAGAPASTKTSRECSRRRWSAFETKTPPPRGWVTTNKVVKCLPTSIFYKRRQTTSSHQATISKSPHRQAGRGEKSARPPRAHQQQHEQGRTSAPACNAQLAYLRWIQRGATRTLSPKEWGEPNGEKAAWDPTTKAQRELRQQVEEQHPYRVQGVTQRGEIE